MSMLRVGMAPNLIHHSRVVDVDEFVFQINVGKNLFHMMLQMFDIVGHDKLLSLIHI